MRLTYEEYTISLSVYLNSRAISVFGLIGTLHDGCHRPVAETVMSDA